MVIKNKIYIHHYHTKSLFYKILHNTTHRVYRLNNSVGSVFCKYNDLDIEVIFDPILNDNDEGLGIIFTNLKFLCGSLKTNLIFCSNDIPEAND